MPDDFNGDGYADLALAVPRKGDPDATAIVYGSRHGLDPRTTTMLTYWLPGVVSKGSVHDKTADLDGDGYADVVVRATLTSAPLMVFWGGRSRVAAKPRPVALPFPADRYVSASVLGDFDGDGAADLGVWLTGPGEGPFAGTVSLAILYGPFTRAGAASRHTLKPWPLEYAFQVSADRIHGRRATSLLIGQTNGDNQGPAWLVRAGPDGPVWKGRDLGEGNATAFGDFDGDGVRDVAVGDTGSRDDEIDKGREPPETGSTLTVHFGDGRRQRFTGVRGEAVTADLNGDDQDDLVIGGGWPFDGDPLRPRVFWGGPQGLRRGAALRTRATPAASGDYDHDGRDEVVLIVDGRIQVWNERRMTGGFKIAGLPG
ncbi:Repeat domain-containing protein [Nonomuraea solani]|uniref:Repeat domain-containing protein n=1 Tax=Nonomuraea solani TaxID=1144553 RepID=A0A1H6EG69_9ACTN|nr:VCBS repeat-containing protein [Nonomuraea solani]SEG95824.1 Repeat domain-containing protein [Nonomuraea solani]